MGSGSSTIHVMKSIEVSFIDKKTGKIFPEDTILKISEEACKEFDYKPTYYNAYKLDHSGKNPYTSYANYLNNKI